MQPENGRHRRVRQRVFLQSVVDVVVQGRLVQPPPRARDIAEDGIGLQAGVELPEGGLLKLFVPLQLSRFGSKRLLLFDGQIVWTRNGMVGVRFVQPSPESSAPLRRFMQHRRRRSGNIWPL